MNKTKVKEWKYELHSKERYKMPAKMSETGSECMLH